MRVNKKMIKAYLIHVNELTKKKYDLDIWNPGRPTYKLVDHETQNGISRSLSAGEIFEVLVSVENLLMNESKAMI